MEESLGIILVFPLKRRILILVYILRLGNIWYSSSLTIDYLLQLFKYWDQQNMNIDAKRFLQKERKGENKANLNVVGIQRFYC